MELGHGPGGAPKHTTNGSCATNFNNGETAYLQKASHVQMKQRALPALHEVFPAARGRRCFDARRRPP